MFLLDTNVVFAAVHQAHEHHAIVDGWFSTLREYATSGLIQIGLFRLLIAQAPMHGSPLSPSEAHRVVHALTSSERHRFVSCPPISQEYVGQTAGHKAAFDDYLVQTAQTAGYTLVTLDRPLATRWPGCTLLLGGDL